MSPGSPPESAPPRRTPVLALLGALALLVVIWVGVAVVGGDDEAEPSAGETGAADVAADVVAEGGAGASEGEEGDGAVTVLGADGDRPALALIGDSIFFGAAAVFDERLGDGWELRLHAVPGNTTREQVAGALEVAAAEPPVEQVVINLGTNDVTSLRPLDESTAALTEIVAAYPDARCLHLVTVTDRRRDEGRIERWPEAEALNAAWRGIAASDPRIRVVDWADILRRADGSEPVLLEDQVHPSPAGDEVLVEAIAESLAGCG
ncbi:SGNH/GDSL hydrolase family protein [Rhabdothermincola salaria]|uniref:SGNH/GDSL hydrolase family protein n=1 Tax=Rhabdothermincola salaria TaxID=2903142 RepID=UPI001E43AEB7|nr:SGNH/GDSL hydrolase family protein [Rhabdothermincola salaria]MCD9623874.1 SGNH/GDSL hydrolase family protein [Rhabdothermincola salaria]